MTPTVTCEARRERCSALVDGDCDAAERRELEAHMASCAACRALHDDLTVLRSRLGRLAAQDVPATEALWGQLQARLERPGVRALRRVPVRLAVPLAAAAALALWLHRHGARPEVAEPGVGASPTLRLGVPSGPSDDQLLAEARREMRQADEHYEKAVAELQGVAQRERARWPADFAATYEEKLHDAEAAITRCREAVDVAPDDGSRQAALAAAYQREIDVVEGSISAGELASLDGPMGSAR